MIVRRYTLLIHAPDADEDTVSVGVREGLNEELSFNLPGQLREAEENLTVLLPQGFHATIEVKD
jgi:hypothetical protein